MGKARKRTPYLKSTHSTSLRVDTEQCRSIKEEKWQRLLLMKMLA